MMDAIAILHKSLEIRTNDLREMIDKRTTDLQAMFHNRTMELLDRIKRLEEQVNELKDKR